MLNNKTLLKLLIASPVLLTSAAFATSSPYYIDGGFSYLQHSGSGDSSTVTTYQRPNKVGPFNIVAKNQKPKYNLAFTFGGGYSMSIANNWAWSIGGEYWQSQDKQTGKAYLQNLDGVNYKYTIKMDTFNLVNRLAYMMGDFQIIAGLDLGVTSLDSKNYQGKQSQYSNNGKTTFSYEVDGGLGYNITPDFLLSVLVGYQNLGTAKLGDRTPPPFGSTSGNITQKIAGVKATMLLTYYL